MLSTLSVEVIDIILGFAVSNILNLALVDRVFFALTFHTRRLMILKAKYKPINREILLLRHYHKIVRHRDVRQEISLRFNNKYIVVYCQYIDGSISNNGFDGFLLSYPRDTKYNNLFTGLSIWSSKNVCKESYKTNHSSTTYITYYTICCIDQYIRDIYSLTNIYDIKPIWYKLDSSKQYEITWISR